MIQGLKGSKCHILASYQCMNVGGAKKYQCHGIDGLVSLAPLEIFDLSLWILNFIYPWKFVDVINCIKKKSRKCPKYGKVVCGLDGKTYDNHCTLNATSECKDNPDIQINHNGKCKGKYKNISKNSISISMHG